VWHCRPFSMAPAAPAMVRPQQRPKAASTPTRIVHTAALPDRAASPLAERRWVLATRLAAPPPSPPPTTLATVPTRGALLLAKRRWVLTTRLAAPPPAPLPPPPPQDAPPTRGALAQVATLDVTHSRRPSGTAVPRSCGAAGCPMAHARTYLWVTVHSLGSDTADLDGISSEALYAGRGSNVRGCSVACGVTASSRGSWHSCARQRRRSCCGRACNRLGAGEHLAFARGSDLESTWRMQEAQSWRAPGVCNMRGAGKQPAHATGTQLASSQALERAAFQACISVCSNSPNK